MNVELQINNSPSPNARFVWAPSPCRIRVTNPAGATTPTVSVQITGKSVAGGGEVVFRKGTTGTFSNSVTLTVPMNGSTVPFFVAGRFGKPSVNNGDVTIEARTGTTLVGSTPVMVRVRKNANKLRPKTRLRTKIFTFIDCLFKYQQNLIYEAYISCSHFIFPHNILQHCKTCLRKQL